ncbi:uncharacterized protein TRUGW13939_05674 [Talaromyces rugulosus]|uniref:Uncharacterized protein n=1 Tax=Talaromyces rugulosus TaxID=121627 RepID=A0A7H8QWV9_TALRU|nr:uncharacterized protein TRUGW13939_05674 [Talaromyces rugulosus]QKX58549.1 hypothetical protein TRUGW13939_05674 [Talaromyces rugulosus]
MQAQLDHIKQLALTAEGDTRQQLMFALHDIAYSLEDSNATIHRLGYLHLQTAAVKTGFDLGLFTFLTGAGDSVTLETIVQKTGADVKLLTRLLSYLSSVDIIKQVSLTQYAANQVTKNLAEKVSEAGISHCFETIGPQYQALPGFLAKVGYKYPENELHTVFQDAWKTDMHAFAWFENHPENLKHFNDYMALRRGPELSWLSVYPIREEAAGWEAEKPLYVNIGGGIGHQCAQFVDRYPDVPGRVILQDMPHSIEKALPTPGVEAVVHNFFDPQPVKGAKFYYTRGVLHNHPDYKVKQLLQNTKSAMTPDSVMLLDEMILPEEGVNSYAACMDLSMMAAFAGMERSESQWREILSSVGLKLVKTYVYNPHNYEGVMDVRLA